MELEEKIKKWVKIVNQEYKLDKNNDFSIDFFIKLKDFCKFIFKEDWYLIYYISTDMWGNKELCVLSYYILKEKRTLKKFLQIQKVIKDIAKIEKVRYIIQGSHLNEKLFSFLKRDGYKISTMKKELF